MIEYKFSKDMRILFIGINPHYGSYNRGIPFSNNKTFWYLLNRSGVINEKMDDLRSDMPLKKIYDEKFNQVYKLGLVNVVDRPSRDASYLQKGEEKPGREKILKIIAECKPKVVCFIGKTSYERFLGSKAFNLGWQENIQDSKIYVMHFPIRGEAKIRIEELKEILLKTINN
jgi:double-stranded uracil-DNA glycosylase